MYLGFNFFICLCVTVYAKYANNTHVRVSRQATGCILPEHPSFGQWTLFNQFSPNLSPGEVVASGTVLQITCKNNYKLDGDVATVCINGQWTRIGQCLQTCPSIASTRIMSAKCTYNDRKLDNCDNTVDGTIARFECALFYEDQRLKRHPVSVCFGGRWSNSIPECTPICGKKSNKNNPTLIVGGSNATKGEYPWQVALYTTSDKKLICGGTLINQRVILTAAHCVTNEEGILLSKDRFLVAVGKYFRKYNDAKDSEAQHSTIYKMYIPKQYKGHFQNYAGDMAILITTKTFTISSRVQPVCLDWGFDFYPTLLDPSRTKYGYVSGWGFTTDTKNPSNTLKELKVPLISDQECFQKLSDDNKELKTDDKLCAGFLDAGAGVCKGDSGGGLVSQYGNKFYLIGIVSVSPMLYGTEQGCNSQQYAMYTRVSDYLTKFVLDKEARYRPSLFEDNSCDLDPKCKNPLEENIELSKTECVLPQLPQFGQWVVHRQPGNIVPSKTVIQLECNDNYKADGNVTLVCENGEWSSKPGQCLKMCPSRLSTSSINVTCIYQNKMVENCTEAVHGTIAKFRCAPFHVLSSNNNQEVHTCLDGQWNQTEPQCSPVCGIKQVEATPLIINGHNTPLENYPWQVALYNEERMLICSGTLIKENVILTTAHCIADLKGKLLNKEDYIVAAGKYYREFNDSRDANKAQFSKLHEMFVPRRYKGASQNFFGDIGVLVTKKRFTLSRTVLPACIDLNKELLFNQQDYGFIPGWGFTSESSNPSEILKELKIPVVTQSDCWRDFPEEFELYIQEDKICGGYLNKSKAICKGDTGGGLVMKYNGRYYVTGIASLGPVSSSSPGGCDSQQYSLYTNVSHYVADFIGPILNDFRTDCILPQPPKRSQWLIHEQPGESVPSKTIIQFKCDKNYMANGTNVLYCYNGEWSSKPGQCLKMCPPRSSTSKMHVTCVHQNKMVENCTEAIHGTIGKFQCAPFYEFSSNNKQEVHTCLDGQWDHAEPRCSPVCGVKPVEATPLIINGNNTSIENHPWQVALYDKEKMLLCGGTLINENVILTAAHCITDDRGKLLKKEDYIVTVGKYCRKFNDSRDANKMQFSELQAMFVPDRYKGYVRNYFGNIGILVTKEKFKLARNILPACIDLSKKLPYNQQKYGFVSGWGYTTEDAEPAQVLKELKIPIVSQSDCLEKLPTDFEQFVQEDKICAGYLNKSTSVCKGDSGGGLVMKHDGKYYITGIIALSPVNPREGGCDSQQYSLYTNVSQYITDFIVPKLTQYKT